MSLAVYIGTEKFRDTREGDASAEPAHAVTLGDIATGFSHDTTEGQPALLLSVFTEEALSALEHWLKSDAERTCTIAWPHPSAWLAASLQHANRPKEALWQWSYQADLLVKLYKRKRKQVTLEGYLPNVATVALLPWVAQLTLAQTAPLYRLMAHQLTQEDSLLQQAYSYLKASSGHVANWQQPAVDVVEQSLQQLAHEHQQRDTLKATTESAQAELSHVQQENSQLGEQLATLQQQCNDTQAKHDATQKRLEETTQRLSEKSAQLLETEHAKDTLASQLTEQQATNTQLRQQLDEQQQAATRKANELAKLQDHTYGVEQENAALLEQLMKVQEALEENILANQAQQADLEEKETKLNWLRKKTKSQQARLDERKAELSQLKGDHKKAQQALEKQLAEQTKAAQAQQDAYKALSQASQEALQQVEQQLAQAQQEANALAAAHQAELEQAEENAAKAQQQAQHRKEQLLQEQALLIEQLHQTQEQFRLEAQDKQQLQDTLQTLQKQHQTAQQSLDKLTQAHQKAVKQAEKKDAQASVKYQQLQQEQQLIVAQLHEVQEQLVKTTENAQHYKKQADSRQKTINVLKQEQQLMQHQYESITQWLRASGHRNAAAAYRYSRPFKRALPQQVATIQQSSFFDAQWYCEQYPDVKTSGMEPAEHYLKFGATEGRNPSDKFDTYFYLCEYADVAISGQNPLLHYLRYGQHEERLPARPQQQLPAPAQP
ncbi:hypothetical protein LG409_06155 [Halomonas sp. NyZ770]|uniref:hypothetical protein n=1 Tax=Halomonas sp. NyZ770 TaxID=2883106 RepID=UPI001D0AF561|nr:hypothetical protein [Halomonas sp. NyZ770]UDM08487.1 hypothetical protein LG409_06155 [Halomonas sp. NyZ770]